MKKVALILDSLDKAFPEDGKIRGGANKVNKYIVEYFSSLDNIEFDVISGPTVVKNLDGVHNIITTSLSPLYASVRDEIKEIVSDYDVVLSSDIIFPFGNLFLHSHSIIYRNTNCKNFFETLFQNYKRRERIADFKKLFEDKNRKIFTVSDRLRQDYIKNAEFDENNVVCAYPGVEQKEEPVFTPQDIRTFGIVTNNSINKGAYLFIFVALFLKLVGKKFKAKMFLAHLKKCNFIPVFLKVLFLDRIIELVPANNNLDDFYKQIDCLLLPSINETFGLVVTEAASNTKFSLVSNTAGSSEIIQDGVNGFVFKRTSCPCKNIINLYMKMREVIKLSDEQLKSISLAAFNLSKEYTWEKCIRKIADTLKLNE